MKDHRKELNGVVMDCVSHPKGGWSATVHFETQVLVGTYLSPVAQRPQAEPDAYCITTPDGGCISTDTRCMHQPQAEAVPPGYVLVPVEPDEMWAYQVIRHHQPDLEVGGTAWLKCLKELLHWHAAIAAQGASHE